MCAHAFFGTGHLLFGTDVPYGPAAGETFSRQTIDAIEGMSIPDADKKIQYLPFIPFNQDQMLSFTDNLLNEMLDFSLTFFKESPKLFEYELHKL